MFIVGLTGSIGMGKSYVGSCFKHFKIPVFEADHAVHKILGYQGKATSMIKKHFPTVVKHGEVDRKRLSDIVFKDLAALRKLESIVHPLVHAEEREFVKSFSRRRTRLVVLDIPLLLEGKGNKRCDAVVVVSAPNFVQRSRVMKRPGMTERKFQAILSRQLPDQEKRKRAGYRRCH